MFGALCEGPALRAFDGRTERRDAIDRDLATARTGNGEDGEEEQGGPRANQDDGKTSS